MDKKELTRIVSEVEKENSLFVKKVHLDTLTFPSRIIGRKDQVKELVSFLATHKQGLVVPFIAVYGRSGSGGNPSEGQKDSTKIWLSPRQGKESNRNRIVAGRTNCKELDISIRSC